MLSLLPHDLHLLVVLLRLRVIPLQPKDLVLAELHKVPMLSYFKEVLGGYFRITSSLVLAIVVSPNPKPVGESSQTTPEHSEGYISDNLDIIMIWDDYLQILEKLVFRQRKRLASENLVQVPKIMVSMESVPVNVRVVDQAAGGEVISEESVVYSMRGKFIEINSGIDKEVY